jgi:DNA-binding NarL/FixJ family response regulator
VNKRNVKTGLLLEPSDSDRPLTVVLCGDGFLHRKLLRDSVSSTARLTLIRCADDREQLFAVCRRLNVSVFVARQSFLEQLTSADLVQLTNYGKSCYVLAILESDCLEASAAKMLRLGCRGVLPRQFSSKLLRRAVLAVLQGELWAPNTVVSELLSELLRAASLKTENGLTPQETRILELTSKGYKNSAIAEALFISLETVRWHKRRLNRKLRGPGRFPQDTAAPSSREAAVG